MPHVQAQFFYSSLIPIDDPLSTSSTVGSSSSDGKSGKLPLRPFARGDNNALEKAWLSLQTEEDRRDHLEVRNNEGHKQAATSAEVTAEKRALLVQTLALKHWDLHRSGLTPQDLAVPTEEVALALASSSACCAGLLLEVAEELEKSFCALVRIVTPDLEPESIVRDVTKIITGYRQSARRTRQDTLTDNEAANRSRAASLSNSAQNRSTPGTPRSTKFKLEPRHDGSHTRRVDAVREDGGRPRSGSQASNHSSSPQNPGGIAIPTRHAGVDDGISGKPFVRVENVPTHSPQAPASMPRSMSPAPYLPRDRDIDFAEIVDDPELEIQKQTEALKEKKYSKDSVEVAVGVSRLHMVTLPPLQMKPIYWSPVNDLAIVTRATWFYRDTMLPVPSIVANQLEAGYHELRPWTETWRDEIRCAIDIGPVGEEKVSHQLWPKETGTTRSDEHGLSDFPVVSSDPFCAARCFHGEAAAEGSIDAARSKQGDSIEPSFRPFSTYHVMYKDEREAFMLKPSLKPSAYYGRRPLAKIMKGLTVGIPVVRGFDRKKWERHHSKKQVPDEPGVSAANESHESQGRGVCAACQHEKQRGQVTDLVLVAHGIGQKFAERVESFHFTHAINGFRRAVNIELGSPLVQQIVREDQNGLMILPLNWRMGLSFEDGGPMREEDKDDHSPDGFGLKDIEPKTIPAIRSMISDVMFDIPFYMSHHKGKMIKALVSEANRVYRLWCRNNPGFSDNGRVHIIAHSLGSAMALEILSRQPTTVPRLDLSRVEPETKFFEFDTRNLFLAGSPAGFFLLLERGALIPRKGRRKPGADPDDTLADTIVGDAGTFGCLAVDNIYNVLAKEDPIAYLLNGAVDPGYASSLKIAHVPSTATSIFKAVGNAMRTVVPGMGPAPAPYAPTAQPDDRPPTFRLPSQLELEVHDFTREEIAEKKAFLLNDNGQIDWYLRSGGGPLEIQYLNMLSAHTSYWTNYDFIRMLCIEIGRKPGRGNTLPAMRAVKNTKHLIPR